MNAPTAVLCRIKFFSVEAFFVINMSIVTLIVTKTTIRIFKPSVALFLGTLENTYERFNDTNGQLVSCNWLENY